ncbi:vitamin B12 ABC transporter ATP-binding protein BtuD [Vibrio sp. 10N.261.51.F12]|uniref:vitamin B12 ABC transporter ATP-binding protein BtuD n=1 Tax=Vibrio sp. 10N.261.51.F12 TaxID=3229679 RepID=UPI00354CA17C
MIQVHNLSVGTRLLPLSVSIPEGKLTHIIGPNGSGKSTFLSALTGILEAEGQVTIDDKAVSSLSLADLSLLRAYLNQSSRPAFNMPVYQYLSLSIPSCCDGQNTQVNHAVSEITALLNLTSMLTRTVHHLSGGEWQRVRLAACCLQIWKPINPFAKLLVLDEPSAPLDVGQEKYLHEMIARIMEQGTAVVVANHDLNVTLRRADHVVMLNNGVLVQQGSSDEVLTASNVGQVYSTQAQRVTIHGREYLLFDE